MTKDDIFQNLLQATQNAYRANLQMQAFAGFPSDVAQQRVMPHHCNCRDVFQGDSKLNSNRYAELQDAILAAGDVAHWRETYKGTEISDDFMDRFGCYCIIGEEAPFFSHSLRLWMVYMPAGLYYPWHHHPAEEMYMVVSGSAVFKRKGCPDEILSEGQTSFHTSNQSHAMETRDDPILCLVAWRDSFHAPPELTREPSLASA
ncbi:MAG: hypothetical protein BM559_02650 [Roseobacter sp. MedPE-SWchi]|nr:MAG: hypothetical protein BM559_02650 [Roseobacter sp. MedPE-SWchi]